MRRFTAGWLLTAAVTLGILTPPATSLVSSSVSVAGADTVPVAPFPECPAIGADTSCAVLLVINSDLSVSVYNDGSQGPFDGTEDTLIGIINESKTAVHAITAYGPTDLFGFDGDGICSGVYGTWSQAPATTTVAGDEGSAGCPYAATGATGYEGPDTSFITDPTSSGDGVIDFPNTLPASESTYFSLELAVTSATLAVSVGDLINNQFNCPSTAPALNGGDGAVPQTLGSYTPNTTRATTVSGLPFSPGLTDSGNHIVVADSAQTTVRIKAVNWYGAESTDYVPMGLESQSAAYIASWIANHGFNAVRLPWSNELVECNPLVSPTLVAGDTGLSTLAAQGTLTAMQVYDWVVNALAGAGLYVILDDHTTDAGFCCNSPNVDDNGLWWSSQEHHSNASDFQIGQSHWQTDWTTMVNRYETQPAVIGADLRNEPRDAAYWGGTTNGLPNGMVVDSSQLSPNPLTKCPVIVASSTVAACDWRSAAQAEGNDILGVDSRLLILVEGTSFSTDLTGAYSSPVVLSKRSQLVYSPHVYSFRGLLQRQCELAVPRWS